MIIFTDKNTDHKSHEDHSLLLFYGLLKLDILRMRFVKLLPDSLKSNTSNDSDML